MISDNFESQILALFNTSPLNSQNLILSFFLHLLSFKIIIILWVFLGKNLSNFVSLPWQLDNPYYHTVQYMSKEYTIQTTKYSQTICIVNGDVDVFFGQPPYFPFFLAFPCHNG